MKRVNIALAVVAVALVGAIGWRVAQPPDEPVYQGKRLSEWLNPIGEVDVRAVNDAVLHIGTNAIPTLLRMLRAKDSAWKVKLMALAETQHIIKVKFTPATVWNNAGRWGFTELCADGQSAVPELIEIINQNISYSSRTCALNSFGTMGPSAKEAVPSLLRWSTNSDSEVSRTAIDMLRRIDPEAWVKAGFK